MLLEDTPVSIFVLGKSSRLQEPNAETDHPECSTCPGTRPPQAQQIYSCKDWSFDPIGSTLPVWVCVCMSVNDTFCVCGVCCEACVCACDSALLVPCLWGRG